MKKLVMALVLLMVPVAAMAGMNAFMDMDEMSNNELAATTGQTGITLNATVQVTGGYIAWGDTDGCTTTAATDGWMTMSGIQISSLVITGTTVDICRTGGTSWLTIGVPALTVAGSVANIFIDDAIRTDNGNLPSGNNSLGHLVFNLSLAGTTIEITGHQ